MEVTQILDSPRRCPRCAKRLAQDIGQHESEGDLRTVHYCLHCDYREGHNEHVRPRHSVGRSLRHQLDALRMQGSYEVEIVYDDSPFPEMDFGEDDQCAVR